ncbi:MAG TPA: DUF4091 domain-containing protein [Candidatus Paceibacterota bacterium]|nr:DUF4091 domain-containing protein [Candidatus Paceibacterota bacterium]
MKLPGQYPRWADFLAFLFWNWLFTQGLGAEPRFWVVTETRHVLRSESPGNLHEARLSVARNEWGSFQILVRAEAPIRGLSLQAKLTGPDGRPTDAIQVRLFRQHQLVLDTGTYRNADFKPDGYPDPLIPFEHPVPGETLRDARLKAIPFDLPAQETHGFWVDLYASRNASAGEYRGTCQLTAGQGQVGMIPIHLTVWNFTLPPVPALETEFGSPAGRLRGYYRERAKAGREAEPTNWAAVETECAQVLSDHRLNAVPPGETIRPVFQPDGSFRMPAEQVEALRQFVERYHVNAVQIPHPSAVIKDPEAERDRLRAWLAAFDVVAKELNRDHLIFYTYLRDEPNTLEDYRYVQRWGRAIREAKSVVKVLVVEQTWTAPGQGGADSAWGDLYGAVDIWCPLFSLHKQESAARRQALGETIWTYTALCQGEPTPWWHIDYPLLNYRVPTCVAWRYRMRGLLYWGGLSYWGPADDPWLQAPYYTGNDAPQQGKKGVVFYGEGSLAYPGRAVGCEGVVPTIRLKALRDAIEDYDYLALLEHQGQASEADAIVAPLAASFFAWDKDPAAYERARTALGTLILAGPKQR